MGGVAIFLPFLILKLHKTKKDLDKKRKDLTEQIFNPKGIFFDNLSEKQLYEDLIKYGFDCNDIFYNLYIPISNNQSNNQEFSQIDLALLTRVGLIVFEVKSYNGVVRGCVDDETWTASYGSGYRQQDYTFQNPIIQNTNHVIWLNKFLKQKIKFFNVVIFYGNCELRYTKYISNNRSVIHSYDLKHYLDKILFENDNNTFDEQKIIKLLTVANQNGNNNLIKYQHVQNIKEKYNY